MGELLSGILRQSPNAANSLKNIIQKDAEGVIRFLNDLSGDGVSIKSVFEGYKSGVKKSFGEAINELQKAHDGITTKLNLQDGAQSELAAEFNQLSKGIFGDIMRPGAKKILADLAQGKEIGIKEINALRTELNALIKNSDGAQRYALNRLKGFIEGDLMDDIITRGPDPKASRQLYETALKNYADMAQASQSQWGKITKNADRGDDSVIKAMAKTLDEGASGNSVEKFLSKLAEADRQKAELSIIKGLLERVTSKDELTAINYHKLSEMLANKGFKSDGAKQFIRLIDNLARAIGEDFKLAGAVSQFTKASKSSQGISHDIAARFKTMGASRATNTILRLLPLIGRQPSLIHHLEQAAIKAKNYDGFIKGVVNEAKSSELASPLKRELVKFATELSKAKNSDLTSPKSANSVATSLKDDKLKGANWVSKDDGKLIFGDDYQFELNERLKGVTGINERVTASLAWLQNRHPEMYQNRRAVKEMIEFVINNEPQTSTAKSANSVLLKKSNGDRVDEIVIDKTDKKVIHANRRKKNASEKSAAAGEDALHSHTSLAVSNGRGVNVGGISPLSAAGKTIPNKPLNSAETPAQKAKNEINRQNRARLKAGKPELTAKQKQNITKEIFSQAQKSSEAKTLKIEAIKGDKPKREKPSPNKIASALNPQNIAKNIIDMPAKAYKNIDDFRGGFDSADNIKGSIKTPIGNVRVDINHAFAHFTQNTHGKNRNSIKGGFFETFKQPLVITSHKRNGAQSIYFYKPFKDKNGSLLNIFGIGIDNSGKIDFKTYYADSNGSRMREILGLKDENVLYIKE